MSKPIYRLDASLVQDLRVRTSTISRNIQNGMRHIQAALELIDP